MNRKQFIFLFIWLLIPGYGAVAIAQPGSLKWKVAIGGQILSSPVIAPGGDIFVGSHDDHLYAIGLDGNIRWAYETGFWVQSTPAIGADEVVCVGSQDH